MCHAAPQAWLADTQAVIRSRLQASSHSGHGTTGAILLRYVAATYRPQIRFLCHTCRHPLAQVMQDAWFMAALKGSREAQSLIRITRVLLADMAGYMFRVSPLLPSLLPEAEAELPNLDRDASAVFQVGSAV